MTSAMSSLTAEDSDKLRRAFNAVLIQISHKLDKIQQEELRFYCSGLIPTEDTGSLNMLRSLEYACKISWDNVSFLKGALSVIQRLDLVGLLTAFETRRNITMLLDFYARRRLGLDLPCVSASIMSMKTTAENLLNVVTETVKGGFDVANFRSLVESKKDIQRVFAEEVDVRSGLQSPWSKLTLLVVIAGEIIAAAEASRSEELRKNEAMELSFVEAGDLSSRMMELGSWEDFCDHVRERYNQIQGHQEESNHSNSVVADIVQQLKESAFFL